MKKAESGDPKIAKIFAHAMGGKDGTEGRNDCGYEGRFKFEDTARIFGWIAPEGEGMCDYPGWCPLYKEGKCPLEEEQR